MATLDEALAAARDFCGNGHFTAAEGIYRQILGVYPDHAEAQRRMDMLENNLPTRAVLEAIRVANRLITDQNLLSGQLLIERILSDPRHADPKRLERFGAKSYSQNGEDGMIAEIFRRIGTANRIFFEFGVEDGLQNNSLLLLYQGWQGVWLEGVEGHVASIRQRFASVLDNGRLRVRNCYVNRDNINPILEEMGVPDDLDLMSIDVDSIDYYIFEALRAARPRVIVIEYNSKLPPPTRAVIPYNDDFRWHGTDYFGASLQSLTDLADRKGYRLVGCDITGTNAFFVRADLAGEHFQSPPTADNFYHPPRYHLSVYAYTAGHAPDFGVYEPR